MSVDAARLLREAASSRATKDANDVMSDEERLRLKIAHMRKKAAAVQVALTDDDCRRQHGPGYRAYLDFDGRQFGEEHCERARGARGTDDTVSDAISHPIDTTKSMLRGGAHKLGKWLGDW